jgi:hypothetical protein
MVHQVPFLGHSSRGPRRLIILDGEIFETLQSRARQAAEALEVELDNNLRFVSPEFFIGIMPSLGENKAVIALPAHFS